MNENARAFQDALERVYQKKTLTGFLLKNSENYELKPKFKL